MIDVEVDAACVVLRTNTVPYFVVALRLTAETSVHAGNINLSISIRLDPT